MGKRIIIWIVLIIGVVFGARACYHKLMCEYISVVHFSDPKQQLISIHDSTMLNIRCKLLEGSAFSKIEVVLRFDHKGSDLTIDKLDVSLTPINGNEAFVLDNVFSYKDTIDPVYWDDAKIKVKEFERFPASCYRISTGKDHNSYSFEFRTKEKLSDAFLVKIIGEFDRQGKKIVINEKIRLEKTTEWVFIELMT